MLKRPERYATLLRVRQREEDRRAAALSLATGAVHVAESRRESLVEMHDDAMRRASDAASGTDVRAMEQNVGYERHLTQMIARTDGDIMALNETRSQRQTDFEASHRSRKMIDSLEERVSLRWERHVDREERKAIEETVAMRHSARRQGRKAR